MTRIIGLLGPKGAGKSTVAQYLVEKYGATRYSFAGQLKKLALRAFDLRPEQVYGTQEQKEAIDDRYGLSGRDFCQRIGKGMRDIYGEDIHWKGVLRQIFADAPVIAVIDDVRYHNEAEGLLSEAAEVWRLYPVEAPPEPDHESEAQWMTAPCTAEIRPPEYGLIGLHKLVDERMRSMMIPFEHILELLQRGSILVHVQKHVDMGVPQHVVDASNHLMLRFGYELHPSIVDLMVDKSGISGTLDFNGRAHHCVIPWNAVIRVYSEAPVTTVQKTSHLKLVD